MATPRIDIQGRDFNYLRALEYAGKGYWLCLCACGAHKRVRGKSLRNGETKSCGCKKRSLISSSRRCHGMHGTRVYRIWFGMKSRCYRPANDNYALYGGRGITVCKRWRGSFAAFFDDMGPPPSTTHSIDRIDNNGNYEPVNCRWATLLEQGSNKRNNRRIEFRGEVKTLAEWSRSLGITPQALYRRINKYGWSLESALTRKKGERLCQTIL